MWVDLFNIDGFSKPKEIVEINCLDCSWSWRDEKTNGVCGTCEGSWKAKAAEWSSAHVADQLNNAGVVDILQLPENEVDN